MNLEKDPVEKDIITVGQLDSFCFVRFVQSGEMCMFVDKVTISPGTEMARFVYLGTGTVVLKHFQDEVKLIKLCLRGNKFMTFGDLDVGDWFCFLTFPLCDYMKVDYGECGKGCVDLKTGKFSTPDASERVILCKEPVAWEFV